jgi:hypothetical protein
VGGALRTYRRSLDTWFHGRDRCGHTVETAPNRPANGRARLIPKAAAHLLSNVLGNFEGRRRNLLNIFETRAEEMEEAFAPHAELNKTQRRLTGAYFLNEYSFEASALFNPRIVRHPDQSGTTENSCRFILSLRAIGEGHTSSLTFRSGTISSDGSVAVDPTARLASVPKVKSRMSTPTGDVVEVHFQQQSAQRAGRRYRATLILLKLRGVSAAATGGCCQSMA